MSPDPKFVSEALQVVWTAGHPDEGSLHTWMDGAFDGRAEAEVEAHLQLCAACRAEVATLRGYDAASVRIMGALDVPISGAAYSVSGGRRIAKVSEPAAQTSLPVRRIWWTRPSTRIAAGVALAVGASTWLVQRRHGEGRVAAASPTAPASATAPTAANAPAAAPVQPDDSSSAHVRAQAGLAPAPRMVANAPGRAHSAATVAELPASTRTSTDSATSRASAESAQPALLVVRGTVRGADTRAPVAYAQVQVGRGYSVVSDSLGRYAISIPNVARGDSVRLQVRRIGYDSWATVAVANADTVTLDVGMAESSFSLSTVVTTAAPAPLRRSMAGSTATVATATTAASAPSATSAAPVATATAAATPAPVSGKSQPRTQPAAQAQQRQPSTVRGPVLHGDREQYDRINDNPFLAVSGNPRSTFSVDVDRASYGNVRRFINQGRTPPPDAVRIEELVNYFPYDLPQPRGNAPVAIVTETMAAPWQPKHRLVRIALQARRIDTEALPPSNLVFLIDVSGSMQSPDKLPLVKESLRLLVQQLRPQDRVALVVYAGAAGLVLPGTSGDDKSRIVAAIDRLEAGGSTAGGAGLELAYRTAKESFLPRGNNRVILATDGDFNVGVSSDGEMERLIEIKRDEGTYLTILGFGTGNYQDAKMEKLARRGNGNYAYVDDIAEARKMLVREMGGTLVTVANDVKLQVEFNPAAVRAYRLIGYEDRLLATEDFADDRKDAGDMGAGHSVTALYEVVPANVEGTVTLREQDALRYQVPPGDGPRTGIGRGELMHVRLRYKIPGNATSRLIAAPVRDDRNGRASADFRFAASVASFGMVLRQSEHRGNATLASILELARSATGHDEDGYRAEFIGLVEKLERCRAEERPACR